MFFSLFEPNKEQPQAADETRASASADTSEQAARPPATAVQDGVLGAAQAYMAGRDTPHFLDLESRLGDGAMRSLAASHVMNGKSIADAVDFVTGYYGRVHSDITERDDLSRQRIRTHLRTIDDEIAEVRDECNENRKAQAEVDRALQQARKELPGVLAETRQIACKLRQERLASFEDDMKAVDEINQRREQNIIEQSKAEIRFAHEVRKAWVQAAKDEWNENREQYKERIAGLEAEQGRIDEELNRVRRHIQGLRSVGVTRNVSGFLFWTGTLTVAASAGFIAEAINRHTGTKSQLNAALEVLRVLLIGDGVPTPGRLLGGFSAAAAILAVFVTLIFAASWIAAQYRPGKDGRKTRRTDRVDKSASGWIARILPPHIIPGEVVSGLSGLTPQAVIQLVPMFVATFLSVCLLVALSPANANWISVDMGTAVALVLSFHSICILYATFVLGPRLMRMLDTAMDVTGSKPPLRIWLSEAVLTLFAVSALAGVAMLMLMPRFTIATQVLTPAALFLLSGGFALPFSIVFRGIYKDHEFLEGRRAFYRREIAELQCPLQPDLDEELLQKGVLLIKNRTAEREQQYLYQLRRYYYDDIGDLQRFQASMERLGGLHEEDAEPESSWRQARSILRETRLGLRFPETLVYNRPVSPEVLQQFEPVYRKRCEVRDRIVSLEASHKELARRIEAGEKRIAELRKQSSEYEAQLIELTRRQFDWSLKLSRNCKEDEIALHEAWVVAEMGSRSRGRGHAAAA
jgi:prefoldin subunit 5